MSVDDYDVINDTHFLRWPLVLLADPSVLVVLGLPGGIRYKTKHHYWTSLSHRITHADVDLEMHCTGQS